VIKKVEEKVPLTGRVAGTAWAKADQDDIDLFPWHTSGDKQATAVRVLYDATTLYVQFICQDKHIFAKAGKLNDPVHLDSCVEFFLNPHPQKASAYVNFEWNCCGVQHTGFGPDRHVRKEITPDLAARMSIVTSVATPRKEESPADNGWWLCAAIPFEVLEEMTGSTVRPGRGTVWRGNFFRCGGKTDDQYACWNAISTPSPDFHRPEFFGELRFD